MENAKKGMITKNRTWKKILKKKNKEKKARKRKEKKEKQKAEKEERKKEKQALKTLENMRKELKTMGVTINSNLEKEKNKKRHKKNASSIINLSMLNLNSHSKQINKKRKEIGNEISKLDYKLVILKKQINDREIALEKEKFNLQRQKQTFEQVL